MACGKCGSKMRLCPVSLGVAVGITCGLAVFLWAVWVMMYGLPASMPANMQPSFNWTAISVHALWAVLKGFLFGFFIALIYDLISCWCKGPCCRCSNPSCGCQSGNVGK